jgi:hypothetical protein
MTAEPRHGHLASTARAQPVTHVPQTPLLASVPGPPLVWLTQCHTRVDTTIPMPHWVTSKPRRLRQQIRK